MAGGVIVTQITGRLWMIGDESITLPEGTEPSGAILAHALNVAAGSAPLQIEVRGMGTVIFLVAHPDGSVTSAPGGPLSPAALRWLRPAGTLTVETELPAARGVLAPILFGAHHGAGTTVWAQLLGGQESDEPLPGAVLVARTTLTGVEAAKTSTATAAAALLVADAPGKVPPDVARSIRVLEGAIRVVRAPWVPALRGRVSAPAGTENTKAVAKVAAALSLNRRTS